MTQLDVLQNPIVKDVEGNYFCLGCCVVQEPGEHFKLYKDADGQVILAFCEDCEPSIDELQIIAAQDLTCIKDTNTPTIVKTDIDDPFERPKPTYGAPHQTIRDKINA